MANIQVKNIRKTDTENVYCGPAVVEVRSDAAGTDSAVQVWAIDPTRKNGGFSMALSVEEARSLARDLLHHAANAETSAL